MDIKNILSNQKYHYVLQDLHKGTINQINQRAEGNIELTYPELKYNLGMSSADSHSIIEGLFDQGLLEKKPKGQTLACPYDDSLHIRPHLYCSKCSSSDVAKKDLIDHYKCGNIDSEDKYTKDQELVCPKCSRTLNQIGVDYKKMPAYICRKCGERMSTPPIQFECKEFSHIFKVNDAHMKELYSYTVTGEGRKLLDKELFDFAPIIKYFESLGYRVKSPMILPGFSGIKHQFDILGVRTNKRREALLLKLVPTDHSLQAEEIQRIFAEVMDTQPDHMIIVALPESSSDAKSYAQITNITLIDGKNADDILDELKTIKWEDTKIRYAQDAK